MRFLLQILILIGLACVAGVSVAQTDEALEIPDAQASLIQNTFVAAPISGLVSQVLVHAGSPVQPGDPLVQLDTEQSTAELEATRATYDAARLLSENDVRVRYAQRTMEVRQRELEQSYEANQRYPGTISESEISKQQLEVDQARLAIEQSEHDHQIASANVREKSAAVLISEAQLRRHAIAAPVSGEVVEVAVEPGEWVETGKPLVRIIGLDPLRIECFVDGNVHGDELIGRKVEFTPTEISRDAGTADTIRLVGEVTFVSPELHPVTGQARLWATVANPDRIARAGMHGRLLILTP